MKSSPPPSPTPPPPGFSPPPRMPPGFSPPPRMPPDGKPNGEPPFGEGLGSSNFNSLLAGEIILAFTGVILFWSIVVLIAQFRLARKYSSFWLLFGQNLADCIVIMQTIWFGFEICVGSLFFPSLDARWVSFIYRIGFLPSLFFHVAIAVNRTQLILKTEQREIIWAIGTTLKITGFCWLLGEVVNIALLLANPSPNAGYYDHLRESFSFGPGDREQAAVLLIYEVSISAAVFAVVVAVYFVAIAVSACRRANIDDIGKIQSGTSQMIQAAERRLTIICIVSFFPFAVYTTIHYLAPPHPDDHLLMIMKTLLGVTVNGLNAILLTVFSSLVRREIRALFGYSRESTTVVAISTISHRRFTK